MKTERFSGSIAIVTGAARGIGEGIASRLAEEGARVILVDVIPELDETVQRLAGDGHDVVGVRADVADPDGIAEIVGQAAGTEGRIDILVNNAGISPKKDGRKFFVEEIDPDNWERVMRVNLTAPFLLTQACIPALRRSQRGRVINIISQAARARPTLTSGHYAASKAGLMGFTRALANELGPDGITVNSVAPGLIETPLFAMFTPEQRANAVRNVPIPRFGTPKDIAAAVAFLASQDADYITGTVIDVNGGLFMT